MEVSVDGHDFDVSPEFAAGLFSMYTFFVNVVNMEDLLIKFNDVNISEVQNDSDITEIINPEYDAVYDSNDFDLNWNPNTQSWSEYLHSIFLRLYPSFINRFTYSIVLISYDPNEELYEYSVCFFNNLNFIQGMQTLALWLNVNFNDYVKYIVRNSDSQLMVIV